MDQLITHYLLTKEDQQQVSSSTSKSMNKSTKQQQSAITSTPAKIISSLSKVLNIDKDDKNQLFNQDSFLTSIPDDNDIETSINSYKNKIVKCNAEIQTSILETLQPQLKQQVKENGSTTTSLSNLFSALVINSAINDSINKNLNSVVPVAFMPINALLPYMQKFCDDFQNNSNKLDSNHPILLNKYFLSQQQQPPCKESYGDCESLLNNKKQEQKPSRKSDIISQAQEFSSTIDNRLSFSSQINSSSNVLLPQIEVNTNSLQFYCITEGCQDFRSFQI